MADVGGKARKSAGPVPRCNNVRRSQGRSCGVRPDGTWVIGTARILFGRYPCR